MSTVHYKLFSDVSEESGAGKKVAVTGIAGVGAGISIGRIALKHKKKELERKISTSENTISRSIKASDKFAKENLEGTKNKLKNLINPRRKAVLEAREDDIFHRGAEKAMKEAGDARAKLNKINNLLETHGKIVNTVKEEAKKVGDVVTKHVTKFKNKKRSADFMRKGKAYRRIVKK